MRLMTQEELKAVLRYDAETGVFTRVLASGNSKRGAVAGSIKKSNGYVEISIGDVSYYAHRLAVLYVTGEWPVGQVDHRDTVRSNNRWGNLRQATGSQNQSNRGPTRANKSGVKGAYFNKQKGKFQSTIQANGRTVSLGWFGTAEEAGAAWAAASKQIHGDFHRIERVR